MPNSGHMSMVVKCVGALLPWPAGFLPRTATPWMPGRLASARLPCCRRAAGARGACMRRLYQPGHSTQWLAGDVLGQKLTAESPGAVPKKMQDQPQAMSCMLQSSAFILLQVAVCTGLSALTLTCNRTSTGCLHCCSSRLQRSRQVPHLLNCMQPRVSSRIPRAVACPSLNVPNARCLTHAWHHLKHEARQARWSSHHSHLHARTNMQAISGGWQMHWPELAMHCRAHCMCNQGSQPSSQRKQMAPEHAGKCTRVSPHAAQRGSS